jgi:hypothetical protein
MVPMMLLHVDAPRAYRRELQQMFAQRSLEADEIAVKRDRILVRMQAPLACLIGLERQVLQGTDGAAQVLCWLSRYIPAPRAALEEVHS